MRLLGFDIPSRKSLVERTKAPASLNPIYSLSTTWGYVREAFAGAWQTNTVLSRTETISYFAVYACISLIAQDISKMRVKLMEHDAREDIWEEITSAAFTPVLRKPNRYQTRIKFLENWVTSKLISGNTYVLLERDSRGVVVSMYVLDPQRVTPLVSDSGDVYYDLKTDLLAGIQDSTTIVPASEIIHDTAITLFHPLCGVSPLYACGLAAMQGVSIQTNSSKLFGNLSRPSGMLVAPGAISNETAQRLKEQWESNYSGNNVGKTAVLGDGLKYEALTITPEDAQMIEQLKMSGEVVCSTFHVPPYMIGLGTLPTYDNIEPLNQQYYAQALQAPIESIELLLDEALGLPPLNYGTELDLDNLLRMDTGRRFDTYQKAVGAGVLAPNEARRKEGMRGVKGGESPYLQQQNYSLAALAKRDAQDDPFGSKTPAPPPAPPPTDGGDTPPPDEGSPPQKSIEVIVHPAPVTLPAPTPIDEAMVTALLRSELGLVPSPRDTVINITNQMPEAAPPVVHVTNAPPQNVINVEPAAAPVIHVAPADVVVRELPAPVVQIDNVVEAAPAPQVTVKNLVEAPVVNVEPSIEVAAPSVTVEAPAVTVAAPTVEVAAPSVTVVNEAAEYQVTEQEIVRDAKGRAKGMKTTRRRIVRQGDA